MVLEAKSLTPWVMFPLAKDLIHILLLASGYSLVYRRTDNTCLHVLFFSLSFSLLPFTVSLPCSFSFLLCSLACSNSLPSTPLSYFLVPHIPSSSLVLDCSHVLSPPTYSLTCASPTPCTLFLLGVLLESDLFQMPPS